MGAFEDILGDGTSGGRAPVGKGTVAAQGGAADAGNGGQGTHKGFDVEKMEGAGIKRVPYAAVEGTSGGDGSAGGNPAGKEDSPGLIGKKPERLSYEELFKLLNPYQPPTQEDLEKERKKQKREKVFAAIGDGISALSNLYFTTQYAPNMYTGVNNVSKRVRERWDKLVAERNANMTAYVNGLMRARQADDAYNDNERLWARQIGLDKIKQERDKAADKRAEADEKRKEELHPFAVREAKGKAKTAETEAEYAEEYQQSRVEKNKAASKASYAHARDAGGGNRYHGRFRGKDYKTPADYEKAVMDAVKVYGEKIMPYEVLETDYWGNPKNIRKKSIAELAAEVEELDKTGLGWGLENGNENETDW